MNNKDYLKIQQKRGAEPSGTGLTTKTMEAVINDCRMSIQNKSERYRDLNSSDKKEAIKRIILEYVNTDQPRVKEFTLGDGTSDIVNLTNKLVEAITDYDILTAAMNDDSIYEIRGNGKEIKIEREGRIQDLYDNNGNIVSFNTPEQQDIILKKMLGDVRLTPKDALVNSRTVEGYRIAAVHSSAMSPDPNNPSADKYHSFVLRKLRKSKMGLDSIVLYKSMSDNMARFLAVGAEGGLTTLYCGPTASGKTSLMNAALKSVPVDVRTVLLQNPSEIDMRLTDSSGRVINDVLHLEAIEKENPSTNDPTMENLMAHILRLSPVDVCLGEIRANKEFAMAMMIMGAGHPLFASLHAENSKGAVSRFLRAYMAASNETIETALPGLTDLLKLIVVQKIMRDGTRKVLQISEVLGVDPENHSSPLLNDLYIFEPTGDPVYDSTGRVKDIPGVHKRVGKLSEGTIRRLKLEGIQESRFDYLTKKMDTEEKETYNGKNIVGYNSKLEK